MATKSAVRAVRLRQRDGADLGRLLDSDPMGNVYLRSELRLGMDAGEWWGIRDGAELRAAALAGALLVPCIPSPVDARSLAEVVSTTAYPRMVVGPRESVIALFNAFDRPAREVRDPQHLMAVDRTTFVAQRETQVRRSTRMDVDALVVAAAAMHREEMGIDPLSIDAPGWRARMTSLVDRGWSWVWTERGGVVFKAELSAWTPDVVQIQGVWTHPDHRGRGIGCAGLAAVCHALLSTVPVCTLYVNHYNGAALALYRRLGFRRVADFATVIY